MFSQGYLKIIMGPMFASKTSIGAGEFSSLLSFKGSKGIYISHSIDCGEGRREMECGTTHNPMLEINGVDKISVSKLADLDLSEYSVIFLDEAQFFGDEIDLTSSVKNWIQDGKNVIVAGLVSDFNGNSFGHVNKLIHMADDIKLLKPFCTKCQEIGMYNRCSFTSRVEKVDVVEDVGGEDKYFPCCRNHR